MKIHYSLLTEQWPWWVLVFPVPEASSHWLFSKQHLLPKEQNNWWIQSINALSQVAMWHPSQLISPYEIKARLVSIHSLNGGVFLLLSMTTIQAFISVSFSLPFAMVREKTLGENEQLKFKHMHWKWQKYSLGVISQNYIFPWFAKGGWLEAKLAPVGLQLIINGHFIYHCWGKDLGKGNIISRNVIGGRGESELRIVREEWFLNLTK